MKVMTVVLFLNLLVSCGKKESAKELTGAQQIDKTSGKNDSKYPSLAFNSDSDLPPCTSAINGALAYIKSSATFKNCDTGNWVALEAKEDKDSGKITKVSNVLFNGDLDGWANRDATFSGSVIYYADGTKFLLATLDVLNDLGSTNDSDYVISNIPMNMITTPQKPLAVFSVGVDGNVDIDGPGPATDHKVFVEFNESTKIWSIFLDADDDNESSAGDLLIGSLTENVI